MNSDAVTTISGSHTTRLSGVPCATFSSAARSRPATKSVATAAGDTHSTRTCGPSTRASDMVWCRVRLWRRSNRYCCPSR
jgi:hypothetical protein